MKQDDTWLYPWFNRIEAAIAEGALLEIGCGEGRDTIVLRSRGYPVVALDRSPGRLLECRARSGGPLLLTNIEQGLPFAGSSFDVIVASLSLHYFSWAASEQLMQEIRRVAMPKAFLLVRVNSVRDVNFGAGAGELLEEDYYWVRGRKKRFFDEAAVRKLCADLAIEHLAERTIDRYEKPKVVWEVAVHVVQ